jgi:HEPN domain-containing protein
MSDREHARSLLALARRDWRALAAMKSPIDFDDAIFGFHAQQAVEKTLKAWLALQGIEYPLTHSLHALFELLKEQGEDVTAFSGLASLTQFAVRFRYEELDDQSPPIVRATIQEHAASMISHVQSLVDRS